MARHLLVKKDNLGEVKFEDGPDATVGNGQLLLKIERFALTANNITYGVAGDIIGYWQFFPAEDGWGRIPVWGIGTVRQSQHPDIAVGERYYGYYPMSDELLVKPEKVTDRGFTDAAMHRAQLPVVYNQYSHMTRNTGFDPDLDNHAMLYRPLFTTSFVLDDYLADNDFFRANQIILGSASSKTAFGLAFMLKRRGGVEVVGLTSKTNKGFVESLGLYDSVVTYDTAETIAVKPSAYVDMAGNREVLARVHHHLNDQLLCSCGVGITHWDARGGQDPATLPGAKPEMFFAPTQIVKRNEELGPQVYQRLIGEATNAFYEQVDAWVTIEEHSFANAIDVFNTVRNGAAPDRGYVLVAS